MFAHRKPYGQLFGHAQFTDSALPSHTTQWAHISFEFAIQWSILEIRQSSTLGQSKNFPPSSSDIKRVPIQFQNGKTTE